MLPHIGIFKRHNIHVKWGTIKDWKGPLPVLESNIAENMSTIRREEFSAARRMIRHAYEYIGRQVDAIGRDDSGCPLLPIDALGGITHTKTDCVVVVGKKTPISSIGIDMESMGRLSKPLWKLVFTEEEKKCLSGLSVSEQSIISTSLYSVKESFIKFYCSKMFMPCDMLDLQVTLVPTMFPNQYSANIEHNGNGRVSSLISSMVTHNGRNVFSHVFG